MSNARNREKTTVRDAQTRKRQRFPKMRKNFPRNFNLKGMKIVIDCANGAGYKSGPALLEALGAKVIAIGTKPNGININYKCGSTYPKKMKL